MIEDLIRGTRNLKNGREVGTEEGLAAMTATPQIKIGRSINVTIHQSADVDGTGLKKDVSARRARSRGGTGGEAARTAEAMTTIVVAVAGTAADVCAVLCRGVCLEELHCLLQTLLAQSPSWPSVSLYSFIYMYILIIRAYQISLFEHSLLNK